MYDFKDSIEELEEALNNLWEAMKEEIFLVKYIVGKYNEITGE